MEQSEAQEIMYALTEAAEILNEAMHKLDEAYGTVLNHKRELWYKFSGLNLGKKGT